MLNPAAPPSLTHSHLLSASLDGIILTKADTTWNNLMNAVIREAARRGMKPAELHKMLRVHTSIGVRVGTGFKYLQDAGLSVQGQDANSAWRQTYDLALLMGLSLEVEFAWPDTPKAAMPNVIGHFSVGGSIGAPPEKK